MQFGLKPNLNDNHFTMISAVFEEIAMISLHPRNNPATLYCYSELTQHDLFSGSKGENFDIKSRDVAALGYQPMMCVFDLLLLNGEVLANQPLRQRRRKLADVFNPVEGRLILSDFAEKSTK